MSALNPDHQDYVRWICDPSMEKGKRTIAHLLDRPAEKEPKLDVLKVLGDALGFEVKSQNRRALKNAIQSAMTKLEKRTTALAAPAKKKAKAIDGKAEIVKADDLPSLAAGIQFAQEAIDQIEFSARKAQLPHKLKQGLFCLKARALYLEAEGAKGGRPKNRSESDQFPEEAAEEPASFNDWILTQPLPKASAYDYLRAVEGLGLDHKADEKQLAKAYTTALKAAEKEGSTLSIAKLKNLAKPADQDDDGEEEQAPDPEALAAEAREQAHHIMSTWDKSVKAGNLEHADKATLQQLHEFMTTARDHVAKRIKSTKARSTTSPVAPEKPQP